MLILAIEMSTREGSIALLRDGRKLAAAAWHDAGRPGQSLFTELPGLLQAGAAQPKDVDVFAAGLGPGSYAGLRIAVTAAKAMSMPGGKPVYGVNSAAAIASIVMRGRQVQKVLVLGDARRGRLWSRMFETGDKAPAERSQEWRMAQNSEKIEIPDGCPAVTPDWDRIGDMLIENASRPELLVREPVRPTAEAIGELVFRRMQAGIASEPFAPVYTGAPVEPRAG